MRARGLIGWSLILLAVLFSGDRALAFVLERVVLSSQLRFSRVYRGAMHNDVVIIGNSRGVNAFYAPDVARRTGTSVFNASYNGMSAVAAEAILNDYLDRNARPSLIIFEVTNVYSNEDALKDLDLFNFASPRLAALEARFTPELARAVRVSHLIEFNNELFLRSLYYLRTTDQSWINRTRISGAGIASVDTMAAVHLELVPENVAALVRSVGRVRSEGIQVRFVIAPFLPAYQRKLVNLDEWKRSLEQQIGAPIMDYSDAIADTRDFGDLRHLNFAGSQLLLNRLLKDGVFSDARVSAE